METKARSVRAEQACLSEAMRGRGCSWRQVADEFARRWNLSYLQAFRLARGLSQEQAAERYNGRWHPERPLTGKNISYWEMWPSKSGKEPPLTKLSKLAEVYECSVADLVADVGNDHSSVSPGGAEPALAPEPASPVGDLHARPAAAADLAMIRGVLDTLTSYERQFGGGHACAYAMDYLQRIIGPRLHAAATGPGFGSLCALAAEFSLRVASMQLDAGNAAGSRELLATALPLAQQTGSPVMVAWVLARLGELDMRDLNAGRAVAYTSGAAAMAAQSPPRALSFILAKNALALSMTGDRSETLRVLGKAEDSSAKAGASAEPEWMRFYGPGHLRHDQARCLVNLGMGDQAISAAEESMQWRRLSRPRAFSLAVQAVGHLRSKDNSVDRACQVGAELVTITGQIASDRVKVELARVLNTMRPYAQVSVVRELTEAARPVLNDSP